MMCLGFVAAHEAREPLKALRLDGVVHGVLRLLLLLGSLISLGGLAAFRRFLPGAFPRPILFWALLSITLRSGLACSRLFVSVLRRAHAYLALTQTPIWHELVHVEL